MPTKRKRISRGRTGRLTMDSLVFGELLAFMAGWRPPCNEFETSRSRWLTWAGFMADWLTVRDEFLEHPQWGSGDVFAEDIYRVFGAKGPPTEYGYDEVREAMEAESLRQLLSDVL